jgi:signal peptidase I
MSMQIEEEPKSRGRSALREMLETVLLTLLIYVLVRSFLFENYRVVGYSMDPTLDDQQYLVVNKLEYRLHQPQRGDIIVLRDPQHADRKLIKRIIGLPGEVVETGNGQVIINDRPLQEPYIGGPTRYSQPPTRIPEDHYFVLGDNRNNSSDSHSWGSLAQENIIGKAWFSYWPPADWGLIPHQEYALVP